MEIFADQKGRANLKSPVDEIAKTMLEKSSSSRSAAPGLK